jgi:hypothetical protein
MQESWRSILERVADNLSIDLENNAPAGVRQTRLYWSEPRRRRSRSFDETRDLLARELAAMCSPAFDSRRAEPPRKARGGVQKPVSDRAPMPPEPKSQSQANTQRRAIRRALAAPLISAAILAATVYAIFYLLR